MVEPFAVIEGGLAPNSLGKDTLAETILTTLIQDGLIEPFEFDMDSEELGLVQAGESVIGECTEAEKRVYAASSYVQNCMDDFIREINAQVADSFSARMRDKNTPFDTAVRESLQYEFSEGQKIAIGRFDQAVRLLKDLTGYMIRFRLKQWGPIGIRRNWIIVTYSPQFPHQPNN